MNTDLTAEQIESYQENGFIKIENFLNADELEKMRDAVTESVDSMGNSVLNSRSDKDETFREESVDDEKSYYRRLILNICRREGIDFSSLLFINYLKIEIMGTLPKKFILE